MDASTGLAGAGHFQSHAWFHAVAGAYTGFRGATCQIAGEPMSKDHEPGLFAGEIRIAGTKMLVGCAENSSWGLTRQIGRSKGCFRARICEWRPFATWGTLRLTLDCSLQIGQAYSKFVPWIVATLEQLLETIY